ncbi:hypothetical protein [Nonomuraea angiospora]|uniref:hypothetical protein n=1 Tax=Nonomuraea angiospora TaxID=46172 RepID=UPI0029BC496A|nr:hypothetical protein [Nonomuraea angiospora]MDX3108107.1 hypothetical protein [Nonomuraea angiospora]
MTTGCGPIGMTPGELDRPALSRNGALSREAFTSVLWWVGGTLALMWALMFFLPKQANSQAD